MGRIYSAFDCYSRQSITERLLLVVIASLLASNCIFARKVAEHYGIVSKDNSGTLRCLTNLPCETTPQTAVTVVPV
ncbi:MAG TPA: hypothetical protein VKB21_08890 [Candidatus Acidoferrum sp.]|nr:hypothetical protein [Candidatus Acidoferrum sp.]